MTAFFDLPQGLVGLGLTIAGVWSVLSFLLAVLVGRALGGLSDAV